MTEWVAHSGVPGLGYLGFQKVPEKMAIKNRVHFDVDIEPIDDTVFLTIDIGAKGLHMLLKSRQTIFK